ncbi:MAG: hypothetical protein MI867_01700 [Pseudomonadales bacterium]|nr:hypothetical protein [Pseudomonadales bacterium]
MKSKIPMIMALIPLAVIGFVEANGVDSNTNNDSQDVKYYVPVTHKSYARYIVL